VPIIDSVVQLLLALAAVALIISLQSASVIDVLFIVAAVSVTIAALFTVKAMKEEKKQQ